MTKNFKISEFQCKCGCEMPEDVYMNIVKLANQLQVLRNTIGRPIHLTNAYRCQEHNDSIKGSSSNSQHILGKAADIQVKGFRTEKVANLIEILISNGDMLQGGLGIYNTFVHYDHRRNKARWDNRN